jgi:hypothetical protein
MFESIRRRLTLGYVGIFALILVVLGAVAVASFARQAASQQDELLEQKARGTSDYVRGPLLNDYQTGRDTGGPPRALRLPPSASPSRGQREGLPKKDRRSPRRSMGLKAKCCGW